MLKEKDVYKNPQTGFGNDQARLSVDSFTSIIQTPTILYGEKRKKALKMSKAEKHTADNIWQEVLRNNTDPAALKTDVRKRLDTLSTSPNYSADYTSKLAKSFERRIKNMENARSVTELAESNSSWSKVTDAIAQKSKEVYHSSGFGLNFTAGTLIDINKRIGGKVDELVEAGQVKPDDYEFVKSALEAQAVNHLTTLVTSDDPGSLKGLRKRFNDTFEPQIPEIKKAETQVKKTFLPKGVKKVAAATAIAAAAVLAPLHIPKPKDILSQRQEAMLSASAATLSENPKSENDAKARHLAEESDPKNNPHSVKDNRANSPATSDSKKAQYGPFKPVFDKLAKIFSGRDRSLQTNIKDTPATVTPFETSEPKVTGTPKPVETALTVPETTPAPFQDPENPFKLNDGGIDFSRPYTFTLSINNQTVTIPIDPKVYEDTFTDAQKQQFLRNTAAGGPKVDTRIDRWGHPLVLADSGRWAGKNLTAEILRQLVEGGFYKNDSTNGIVNILASLLQSFNPQANFIGFLDPEIRDENLQKMKNQPVSIEQDGKINSDFEMAEAAHIPHEYVKLITDNRLTLDVLIEITGGENSPYTKYRNADVSLVVFCGEGPDRSNPEWPVFSRYILILEPKTKDEAKPTANSVTESTDGIALAAATKPAVAVRSYWEQIIYDVTHPDDNQSSPISILNNKTNKRNPKIVA